MATDPLAGRTLSPADPHDIVSFSVVCRPASGIDLTRFRETMWTAPLEDILPPDETRRQVTAQLRARGIEVLESKSPILCAKCAVATFESTFGGQLVRAAVGSSIESIVDSRRRQLTGIRNLIRNRARAATSNSRA